MMFISYFVLYFDIDLFRDDDKLLFLLCADERIELAEKGLIEGIDSFFDLEIYFYESDD